MSTYSISLPLANTAYVSTLGEVRRFLAERIDHMAFSNSVSLLLN